MPPDSNMLDLVHAINLHIVVIIVVIIIIFFLPRYSVPREKKNYAMQRKMSSWNGPYSSSSFTKLSWSRIELKR